MGITSNASCECKQLHHIDVKCKGILSRKG